MSADSAHALSQLIRTYTDQITYYQTLARSGEIPEKAAEKEIDMLRKLRDKAAYQLGLLRRHQRGKAG